jgi:hypothetical protein
MTLGGRCSSDVVPQLWMWQPSELWTK